MLVEPVYARDKLEYLHGLEGAILQFEKDKPKDPAWQARDNLRQVAAVHSLAAFVQYTWPVTHPGRALMWGPHIDVVCFAYEQLLYGRVEGHALLVNLPPRCLKSMLTNVTMSAWLWLHNPSAQIMTISGNRKVAYRDNIATRDLILSDRYQRLMKTAVDLLGEHGLGPGDYWELSKAQNQKESFQNTMRGSRIANSADSKITGMGMDLQIVDDIVDKSQVLGSPSQIANNMAKAVALYEEKLSTRMNSPGRSPRVMIMQRLAEADPAGHALARGVSNLILPWNYDSEHPNTSPLDWRKHKGQPLMQMPNSIYPPKAIEARQRQLGDYGFASEFNQLPAPAGGGMFPKEHWSFYKGDGRSLVEHARGRGGTLYLSMDCASKDGDNNDFTVASLVLHWNEDLYVIEQHRVKVDMTGLLELYDALHESWGEHIVKVLIEDASNGTALLQLRPGHGMKPQKHGGKETRASYLQPYHARGGLLLPDGRSWTRLCIREFALFPRGAYDDQVDALAQVAVYIATSKRSGAHIGAAKKRISVFERMLGRTLG